MRYILASALLIAVVLISGLATINIYHNMKLPMLESAKITTYPVVNSEFPFIHEVVSIRLNDQIKKVNAYKDVAEAISQAKQGDIVKIYLGGYGGDVEGTTYIISAMTSTKAHVETHVEAPVYSAHAYIALYGQKMFISANSYLMLHVSSVYDLDCSKVKGKDRGISKQESCNNYKAAALRSNFILLFMNGRLSLEQIKSVMSGHELYLYPLDLQKRGAEVTG